MSEWPEVSSSPCKRRGPTYRDLGEVVLFLDFCFRGGPTYRNNGKHIWHGSPMCWNDS
jgi:hypothetical protein